MTEVQSRRVLIAEDEALIRLDLREMLVEEGYDVVGAAGDGETAVKLAEELRRLDPDQIYSDALGAVAGLSGLHQRPGTRVHIWQDPALEARAEETNGKARG